MKSDNIKQLLASIGSYLEEWEAKDKVSSIEQAIVLNQLQCIYETIRKMEPCVPCIANQTQKESCCETDYEQEPQCNDEIDRQIEKHSEEPSAELQSEQILQDGIIEEVQSDDDVPQIDSDQTTEEFSGELVESVEKISEEKGDDEQIKEDEELAKDDAQDNKEEQRQEEEESIEEAVYQLMGERVSQSEREQFVCELFAQDEAKFLAELEKLEACHSFDEAIIYISENYTWNPDSPIVNDFIARLEAKLT